MAFEVAEETQEVPTATTVAEYTVFRLGQIPSVKIRYAETVEDGNNVFGAVAQRQAEAGRLWDLTLTANTPERVQAMGSLMVGIMMQISRAVLTELGQTAEDVDDGQLLSAIMGIENVDSFIATALEGIEVARRAGEGPELLVMGNAPIVQAP